MPRMKDFTEAYGVKANTIRRWCKEFSPPLSPGTNPAPGKRRTFTNEDANIIDKIAELRKSNFTADKIHDALDAGERGSWPPKGYEAAQDAPGTQANALSGKDKLIAELSHRVGVLEGKLELMTELHDVWQGRAELAEGQLKLLAAPKEDPATTPTEEEDHEMPIPALRAIQIVEDSANISQAQGFADWVESAEKKPSFWKRLFGGRGNNG